MHEGYVIPAREVVDDIRRVTEAKSVRLPTAHEKVEVSIHYSDAEPVGPPLTARTKPPSIHQESTSAPSPRELRSMSQERETGSSRFGVGSGTSFLRSSTRNEELVIP